MRATLLLLAIAMPGLGITACGDTKGGAASRSSSDPQSRTVSSTIADGSHLQNDGDNDVIGDEDNDNGHDNDNDNAEDHKPDDNNSYHDSDDNSILAYGRAANATDKRSIAAVLKRYYASAAADDGREACKLIDPTFSRSIPEDYGQAPGPAYLRGGKTCQAVMSLLFKHFHSELAGPIDVTAIRVKGQQALALLGSTTMVASYVVLRHQHQSWKLQGLSGSPLP